MDEAFSQQGDDSVPTESQSSSKSPIVMDQLQSLMEALRKVYTLILFLDSVA